MGKRAVPLFLTASAALSLAAVAAASVSISSTATPSFTVGLNGADQTATYTVPFTISNSGSTKGNGWNVTASATQFTNGAHTFPATASVVTAVAPPASCSGSNCSLPTPSGSIAYPVTLPNTGAVSIYSAAVNTGDGTNVMTATVQVSAPANIYSGTYTSTLSLQVVAGP